eukprot:m.254106 g.254106  ORF g.254106 m.254106 type:complete len:353 (-) comp22680_c4_seq3:424-1482(-)
MRPNTHAHTQTCTNMREHTHTTKEEGKKNNREKRKKIEWQTELPSQKEKRKKKRKSNQITDAASERAEELATASTDGQRRSTAESASARVHPPRSAAPLFATAQRCSLLVCKKTGVKKQIPHHSRSRFSPRTPVLSPLERNILHKSSLEMGDWKGSFSAIVQLFPHLVGNGLHFFRLSLVCLVSFQQRQDTQREERKPDEHRQQTRGAKAPKGQTRLLRLQQKGLILENGNAESVALGTVSSQTLLNVGFTGLVRMVRNCVSQRNSRGICSPALHVPPLALQLRPHVLQNVFLIPEAVSRGEEVEEQACCNNTGKDQPHPERKEMIPRCAFGLLDFLVRKHIACWLLSRHRL